VLQSPGRVARVGAPVRMIDDATPNTVDAHKVSASLPTVRKLARRALGGEDEETMKLVLCYVAIGDGGQLRYSDPVETESGKGTRAGVQPSTCAKEVQPEL
jgi:hypothetical protein